MFEDDFEVSTPYYEGEDHLCRYCGRLMPLETQRDQVFCYRCRQLGYDREEERE